MVSKIGSFNSWLGKPSTIKSLGDKHYFAVPRFVIQGKSGKYYQLDHPQADHDDPSLLWWGGSAEDVKNGALGSTVIGRRKEEYNEGLPHFDQMIPQMLLSKRARDFLYGSYWTGEDSDRYYKSEPRNGKGDFSKYIDPTLANNDEEVLS